MLAQLRLFLLIIAGCGIFGINPQVEANQHEAKVIFHNLLSVEIELFWEGPEKRISQRPIPPGGESNINAFVGHTFSYDFDGQRHSHTIPDGAAALSEPFVVVLMGGKSEIDVKCTTTVNGSQLANQELTIRVIPWWSPRGATHFLNLVRMGYYNGTALNRVVPKFLTQFGISADYDMRTKFRTTKIPDDPKHDPPIPFAPGTMSFAGSGPNSRTTEVFVVMHETPQAQLEYFGINPWETPFGFINYVDQTPVNKWHAYGDMPPWGEGPNPQKIYEEDGYEYLKKVFPQMDYIEECNVIEIEPEMEEL